MLINGANTPLRELLIIAFGSGIRTEEALGIKKSDVLKDSIKLDDREIIVPNHVLIPLQKMANKSSNGRLFNYSAQYLSAIIPQLALDIIRKKIDWRMMRRTYISLAGEANVPIKLIIKNTGTTYETCEPYIPNGITADKKKLMEVILFKG